MSLAGGLQQPSTDGSERLGEFSQATGRKGTLADINLDMFAEQSRPGGGSASHGASSEGSFGFGFNL